MVDRVETDVSPFKPGGRFVDESGTLTGEAYRFLDQIWKRTGGFQDGAWDTSAIAESLQTQISELNTIVEGLLAERQFADESRALDLLQRIEALEAGLADTAEVSESALRQALNVDRPNVITAAIDRIRLAENAATRTVSGILSSHNVWPSGFGPNGNIANKGTNDAGTNWPSKTLEIKPSVSLKDVRAGSPVLVWISYKLDSTASAYDWMYYEHEIFRVSSGAAIPNYGVTTGRIDSELLFDGVSSGNAHVSGNMGSQAIERTKPGVNGMILIDTPSADGDYDYWFRWRVDDQYAFAVDGFEGPDAGSGTREPRLSDIRIICTNLAR